MLYKSKSNEKKLFKGLFQQFFGHHDYPQPVIIEVPIEIKDLPLMTLRHVLF